MPAKALTIAPGRLIKTIHETAQFGAKFAWGSASTETGVCRLALSDEDKKVKDWFYEETKKLGCEIKIDEVGNMFAIYPGKNTGPPTCMGSHLDTQPTGGRYDGILGVLSGLEVLRTFKDNGFTPNYPVGVINWMNEEGARFPQSLMASSVWAGLQTKEEIYKMESVTDSKPVTVKHELERIGYLGDIPANYEANPIAAHFELHIEQGPILEEQKKEIGIVVGVQAYVWYNVIVKGKAQHTGTTPLNSRADALLTASQMVVKANEIAHKNSGLCSVGILNLEPAVANVIPNKVSFTLDARHETDQGLATIINELKEEFELIAEKGNGSKTSKPLKVEFEHIYTSPAVHFNEKCIQCVEESSNALFGEENCIKMISGAGHDSCSTSARVPTGFIFIPSKDGVSHNPEEYSTPEQCENGFKTLLNAVIKYDELRAIGEA
ncbi:hypothetical protein PACTADRAFT_70170 [Pachysolen tannophilus NRRL Y-2460]|uniref:Peptidase M20 dimerisation domain-containing protein n=1 Tax=Pachysolen tannophilus NRRL Y-2460 TaxID=669874 RepID=A0A1E4TTD5_PACTA|nr:hypothetical protein PACTADRAFT_70170 [Pachysolen tannophilus NRRL Y-2460]